MLFVHAGERNLEKSFPTLVKFGLFYRSTSVMALTATATQHLRATIIDLLEMVDCHEIVPTLNNVNITYVVAKKLPDPMMVL